MDHKTDNKGPSSTEGRKMKIGDKVWVKCEVINHNQHSAWVEVGSRQGRVWVNASDCRPVEPEASKKLNTVTFDIGDPVMSHDGRKGIVEAINVIKDFPITVRHSMREQVSYKFCGVKHDHHPVEPSSSSEIPDSSSDPVNPSHYKQGPAETIDIIEAAIAKAPNNKAAGLHWQVLKYALRCWFKNGIEDLKKARWYLDRLIQEEEVK